MYIDDLYITYIHVFEGKSLAWFYTPSISVVYRCCMASLYSYVQCRVFPMMGSALSIQDTLTHIINSITILNVHCHDITKASQENKINNTESSTMWGSCILHTTRNGHKSVSHSYSLVSLGLLLVSSISLQVAIWHTTSTSLLTTVF